MFEWDRNDLRKNYGETNAGRLLAVVVTERGDYVRVVTAYGLDAGQRRDYNTRRVQGE
jgi:uncharacterized DUF497 family protein